MGNPENPNAGQGPVVLDIGDDIGALIVTMPAVMDGLEVEIISTGTDQRHHAATDHGRLPHHHHSHADHGHDEHDHAAHTHAHGLPPHVAVVGRPLPDGSTSHSLVYPDLVEGSYDLYVRPDGPIRLTAVVRGGEVTYEQWPEGDPTR